MLNGLTPSYLSTCCGDSKRTVTLWVKIADEQGFEALKPRKPTGRPPKLTKEQIMETRTVLEEDDPKKYGHNVWDGPSLSAYIAETYTVIDLFRQLLKTYFAAGGKRLYLILDNAPWQKRPVASFKHRLYPNIKISATR